MKRLNNKQKLIVAIAITLIVVILAIVITTNIISNNRQIANEGYFATTTNANSNLIASYIKKGVKIGGITGTLEVLDTSDADATAEDIAWGKTGYVNGEKITGTYVPSYNYIFTDSLGNEVKVPGGFGVVNPEDNVTDGIVIEDVSAGDENTKGSQFVWVPVGNVKKEDGSIATITLGRYDFNSDGTTTAVLSSWTEDTAESHNSSCGNVIAKDIDDFKTKSTTSGGYYIGRFEAGDALAIDAERTEDSSDKNPIECKKGVYPYNYVTQSQAASLSRGMYSSSKFESDLINSYAWDTALVFIQTFSGDKDYSRQNSLQSTLTKCGEATDGTDNDIRCNIYDMAGNVREWTTETFSYPGYPCVGRGGYYGDSNVYTTTRNYGAKTDEQLQQRFFQTNFIFVTLSACLRCIRRVKLG